MSKSTDKSSVWDVQINFWNMWITMTVWCGSKDDAEWRIAAWKQQHKITSDPFRVVPHTEEKPDYEYTSSHDLVHRLFHKYRASDAIVGIQNEVGLIGHDTVDMKERLDQLWKAVHDDCREFEDQIRRSERQRVAAQVLKLIEETKGLNTISTTVQALRSLLV